MVVGRRRLRADGWVKGAFPVRGRPLSFSKRAGRRSGGVPCTRLPRMRGTNDRAGSVPTLSGLLCIVPRVDQTYFSFVTPGTGLRVIGFSNRPGIFSIPGSREPHEPVQTGSDRHCRPLTEVSPPRHLLPPGGSFVPAATHAVSLRSALQFCR